MTGRVVWRPALLRKKEGGQFTRTGEKPSNRPMHGGFEPTSNKEADLTRSDTTERGKVDD